MRRIFYLSTLLIYLFAFTNPLTAQQKEWTLLVYVVGTDIVQDAIRDLGEMAAAGSTDNVNIVILRGGSNLTGWHTPKSFVMENGQQVAASFVPSTPNMATYTNITEFIDWAIPNYPAEKYAMVFYNHGMAIRGWGWDERVDDQSFVGDLKAGIGESTFSSGGNKFEFIGFDACLMATLEVAYALHSLSKYYIASEETEPWHAWNWTPVIHAMNTQSGMDGKALGRIIIDEYMVQAGQENSHHVTLSLIQMNKVSALRSAVEALIARLDDDIYLGNLMRARAMSEEYSKSASNPASSEDMVDIGDLVSHLLPLEPTLSDVIDDVNTALDEAVIYERSDATRPRATGLSMYMPLTTLVSESTVNHIIDKYYNGLPFSTSIQDFITGRYLTFALSDNNPITGTANGDYDGFRKGNGSEKSGGTTGVYSALTLNHIDDLDHVQVVLMEEITDQPDEYLLLGSTYPDTMVQNEDGSYTFAYEWDEQWLGLNGHPAYVSDIQEFQVHDEEGNLDHTFTRVHIPALLNAGTEDEKNILFSFRFDENFNHELEGVLREPYGENFLLPSKERIQLQAGDQVQLVYEVFDATHSESYFIHDESAVIEIENGNEDLSLEHDPLEPGRYHLGFIPVDHAQNDTIIYDPTVHVISLVSVSEIEEEALEISIGPNPVQDVAFFDFGDPVNGRLTIHNAMGQAVLTKRLSEAKTTSLSIVDLPVGTYIATLTTPDIRVAKQFVKQ